MTNFDPPPSDNDALQPDAVDELLSAELDGELDAAAAALGLAPDAARAALAATPGLDARRRALAAARDALASVPALDPAAVDRLVARAVAPAPGETGTGTGDELAAMRRRDRSRRAVVGIASIAAAIVVVLLGVSVMHGSNGTNAKSAGSALAPTTDANAKASSPTASRTPAPNGAASVDLGDVSAAGSLRHSVEQQLQRRNIAFSNQSKSAGTGATAVVRPGSTAPKLSDTPESADRASQSVCTDSARSRYDLAAAPVLTGTGTSGARRVEVLVFATGEHFTVYVLSGTDCSLVTQLALP